MMDFKDARKEAAILYSGSVVQQVKRNLGLNALALFDFYRNLYAYSLMGELPDDAFGELRSALRLLTRVKGSDGRPLSPTVINRISGELPSLKTYLSFLTRNPTGMPSVWRKLNTLLQGILLDVARDKGVYLGVRRIPTADRRFGWLALRKLPKKEERVERLQDEDPISYAAVKTRRKTLKEIQVGIDAAIAEAGMVASKGKIMGRLVTIATDRVTGEELVYDVDGSVTPVEAYKERLKLFDEAKEKLVLAGNRSLVDPEVLRSLRRLPEGLMESLSDGPLEYAALTDDLAKTDKTTRIFPVRSYTQKTTLASGDEVEIDNKIIMEGRYRGLFLDDVVNASGRLVEGTAYAFDELSGRGVAKKIDPANREPYVTAASVNIRVGNKTVATSKLSVKIGGGHEHKELRDALKVVAGNVPPLKGSISSVLWANQENIRLKALGLLEKLAPETDAKDVKMVNAVLSRIERGLEVLPNQKKALAPLFKRWKIKGTNEVIFYFDPKDFAAIKDRLTGMTLSQGATDQLKAYFEDLARAELAVQDENLGPYSAANLGGFKAESFNPRTGGSTPFDLNISQKKSLAWLDANGNRGVCALGTGIGKSSASLAMMQKFIRDGNADPGAKRDDGQGREVSTNGRFLFVCPQELRGNIRKEAYQRIDQPGVLMDRLDVLSFQEFSGSVKSKKIPKGLQKTEFWKGATEWRAEPYAAIFFDEAHLMANPNNPWSKAAQSVNHPHKVLLTASPLQKSPMESYVLSAIANNKPLRGSDPEAVKNRAEMRRFQDRFCETLGGRIVGIKEDPEDPGLTQDLMTFVKRNIFYVDKSDAKDTLLPDLKQETQVVEMDPEVQALYKVTTANFSKAIQGLYDKFNFAYAEGKLNPDARNKDIERVISTKFAPLIRILNGLSNYPGEMMVELAHMVKTGTYLDAKGKSKELDGELQKMLKGISASYTAQDLRSMGQRMANPKLDAASFNVRAKVAESPQNRTILFTDDPKLCTLTGKRMSEDLPGYHVVALDKTIHIYRNGKEITSYSRAATSEESKAFGVASSTFPLPFKEQDYRRIPDAPVDATLNPSYPKNAWQTFVLNEIVKPEQSFRTLTLLGKSYEVGQNLQTFSTVIHLDRNTWNSESMKQRTARAWRQGQQNVVDEITLDAVYSPGEQGAADKTLDEIRKVFQRMESDLFDKVIRRAQDTALGTEWEGMDKRQASFLSVNKDNAELALSPYMQRSKPTVTAY